MGPGRCDGTSPKLNLLNIVKPILVTVPLMNLNLKSFSFIINSLSNSFNNWFSTFHLTADLDRLIIVEDVNGYSIVWHFYDKQLQI